MIREIQGKIRARFEDSKKIPRAVDVIRNRVGPPDQGLPGPVPGLTRLVPW